MRYMQSGSHSPAERYRGMANCVQRTPNSLPAFQSSPPAFMASPFQNTALPSISRNSMTTLCPACHRIRTTYAPTSVQPVMRSKRRKPRPNPSEPTSNAGKEPPPRVNLENSTLSLRQQLQIAKSNAEDCAPVKPLVRTKFRRRRDEVLRSGKRVKDDAHIPGGKYEYEKDPIIFIDAYNVIGAWPRLRKWRDRSDLETARRLLVDDVTEYSYVRGWDCVVVFDAQGTIVDTKEERTVGKVRVIFTGHENADSFIERSVFQHCENGERQVWAATSDVAQTNFSRAKGAHVMTSTLFIQEVKRARQDTKDKLAEVDGKCMRGNMLMSTVNEETRNRLYELRDKLEAS